MRAEAPSDSPAVDMEAARARKRIRSARLHSLVLAVGAVVSRGHRRLQVDWKLFCGRFSLRKRFSSILFFKRKLNMAHNAADP